MDYKTRFVPGEVIGRREFADGNFQIRVRWDKAMDTAAGEAWVACTRVFYLKALVGRVCEIRPSYAEYDPEWRSTVQTPAAVAYVEYFEVQRG